VKRSRVVRTTAVLAGATALGIGVGSAAFALWNDAESYASQVNTGSLSLSIADANGEGGKATWDAPNGGPITYSLPNGGPGRAANPLSALTSTTPVAVPFTVQSKAYGHWGVDYSLSSLHVSGDRTLIDLVSVKVFEGVPAGQCTPTLSGTAAYSGSVAGFAGLSNRTGVKGIKSSERTDTDNYCVLLSVPAGTGEHKNTFSVEGGSVSGKTDLDSSASWSAVEGELPSDSPARAATLSLTLTATRTDGA
jgi:hypothetical protein